jgi:hypothetical protein
MMVHIEPRIAVAISTNYHYLPRWNLALIHIFRQLESANQKENWACQFYG